MTYRLDISLPGLPPMNSADATHWRTRRAIRLKWEAAVWHATIGKRPEKPLVQARVTIVRRSTREPDFENLTQGGKFLLDGLVRCRVLADDSPAIIGQPTYLWEKAPPRKGHVSITVEGL